MSVVLIEELIGETDELKTDDFESLEFKQADDLALEIALKCVGLEQNYCSLDVWHRKI